MFENFTESARRVIFFARYEASQFGTPTIETEHLLLGLLREASPPIQRFLKNATAADVRQKVEEVLTVHAKTSTTIDLPLSEECRRILGHCVEEAGRLAHHHIGTEHLLLGILREPQCRAAKILREFGAEQGPIRESLAGESKLGQRIPDRAAIHALIDKLPESRLGMLWTTIATMAIHTFPESQLREMYSDALFDEVEAGVPGQARNGSFSSSREEDGVTIVETHHFRDYHRISVTERLRLSDDGRTLAYAHEIAGPRSGQQHQYKKEFDLE